MLVAIALTFGTVIALLLLLPIRLELQVGAGDLAQATGGNRARLTWAWVVSVNLGAAPKRSAPGRARSGGSARTRAQPVLGRFLRAVRSEGFVSAAVHLLKRLLAATHPQGLKIRAALGLEDPADTGQLWAAVGPVSAILWSASGGTIAVEPDFSAPRAAVHAQGRFSVVPLQLIWILLSFALSPPVLRAAWASSRR
jgi:hypothetical protein